MDCHCRPSPARCLVAVTCRLLGQMLVVLVLSGVSLVGSAGVTASAAEETVVFQGAIPLPDHAVDADGTSVEVTGLSGVAWLGDDRYVAVMDNSKYLLLFRLAVSQTGKPLEVDSLRIVTLSQSHDYEDVVPCPAAVVHGLRRERQQVDLPGMTDQEGQEAEEFVLICEEDTPAVRAFSLANGRMVGAVRLPENLLTRRPNRGPESLAIEPDGRWLWTANEEALPADGPSAAAGGGTVVRLTRLPLPGDGAAAGDRSEPDRWGDSPAPAAFQAAYRVDPVHAFVRVFAGQSLSGLAALVSLGKGRLLALERSGAPGLPPFASRIYQIDVGAAVDVSAVADDLAARQGVAVEKRLLWTDSLGINLEGLCLGPVLADGNRGLIAIADNGGIGTPNQLVGLALVPPAPAIRPAVLGVVAALLAIALVVGRLTSP